MKKITMVPVSFILVILFLSSTCSKTQEANLFRVVVSNGSNLAFTDRLVEVDLASLEAPVPDSLLGKMILNPDVPYQLLDDDGDGSPDRLIILTDLEPNGEKTITATAGEEAPLFTTRTQAEISVKTGGAWKDRVYEGGTFENITSLRVPDEHTDHSFDIRYEGPGWESDRVGYRFYLDWRNAVDVFGKTTREMVLQDVGQDGFDSYHEPGDWGMDILKVGESLGLGSIGIWKDGRANRVAETDSIICRIVASGPIYSGIETSYYGWMAGEVKTDARSLLSISAGSRLTRHDFTTSVELDNLCTGIVKDRNAGLLLPEAGGEGWTYIATYGTQSLAGDNLGMAVIFRSGELSEVTQDAHSHVVVLKPSGKTLTYYFLAAWEKEPGGITDKEAFMDYLDETVRRLDNAPSVTLNPRDH